MDVVELAKKAGMVTEFAEMGAASCVNSEGCNAVSVGDLEKFAELVAQQAIAEALVSVSHAVAEEREACAKVVEAEHVGENVDDECTYSKSDGGYNMALRHAAASIRGRSNVDVTGAAPHGRETKL